MTRRIPWPRWAWPRRKPTPERAAGPGLERGEEIVITRRGKRMAQVSAHQLPPQPIDWARIDAVRESMPFQEVSSVELIRRMRDDKY